MSLAIMLGGCASQQPPQQASGAGSAQAKQGTLGGEVPVAGVHYASGSLSGTTGEKGEFRYEDGKEVIFSIGGIQLPPVQGQEEVTLLEVFGTEDDDDTRVVNLGKLLMTLDSDGNPDNGIVVTPETLLAAARTKLADFADPNFAGIVSPLLQALGKEALVANAYGHYTEQGQRVAEPSAAILPEAAAAIAAAEPPKTNFDVEMKKYQIASDKNLIKTMATLASYYGYAWCNGTRSKVVGEDFDVYKDGDSYVMKAHYNRSDPYATSALDFTEVPPSQRLQIVLKNFRYRVDSDNVVLGDISTVNLEPTKIGTCWANNYGNTTDSVNTGFTHWDADTLTHTSNLSFTTSLALSISVTVGGTGGFGGSSVSGSITGGATLTFSGTAGFSETVSTTTQKVFQGGYTSNLAPHTSRAFDVLLARSLSSVPYTMNAEMIFDVVFVGHLSKKWNAATDCDLASIPVVRTMFGGTYETMSGLEELLDRYQHRVIPGYDTAEYGALGIFALPNLPEEWPRLRLKYSWDMMTAKWGEANLASLMENIKQIKYPFVMTGTFHNVAGDHIFVNAKATVPNNGTPLAGAPLTVEVAGGDGLNVDASAGSSTPVSVVQSDGESHGTNVALQSSGAKAKASSTYDAAYSASGAIDGDALGRSFGSYGGWRDATNDQYPDWLQIAFGGKKTIREVDLYMLQNDHLNAVRPTEDLITGRGLKDFKVQCWNGIGWITVPNGLVRDNEKVWKKLAFPYTTTPKIRVKVNKADEGYSRLVEVEAY